MSNKQTKIWLLAFALILAIVGMSASYAAKPLYKGLEKSDELQTSSLTLELPNADANAPAETDFSDVIKQNAQKSPRTAPAVAGAEAAPSSAAKKAAQKAAEPKAVKSTSPCFDNEMPLIKNGQIIGCKSASVVPASSGDLSPFVIPAPPSVVPDLIGDLPPAPKVKIIR